MKADFTDGALNVSGGLLGTMYVPSPLEYGSGDVPTGSFYLVSLFRTSPNDHQKPFGLTIEFIDSDGLRQVVARNTVVFDDPAEGAGCWVSPITLASPKPGQVFFTVSVEGGGKPVSIPVQVRQR
ncbi:MAG: hypothetical protein WA944_09725 [Mycobacterium sp.]